MDAEGLRREAARQASVVPKTCLGNAAVAPGFSPAFAVLKDGATLSTSLLDTTLARRYERRLDCFAMPAKADV